MLECLKSKKVNATPSEIHQDDLEDCINFYEHTLHHKFKGIWARVKGLVFLMNVTKDGEEEKIIKGLLSETLAEMDQAMAEVSRQLSMTRKCLD